MKNFKRIASVFIVVITLTLILAGCNNTKSANSNETTDAYVMDSNLNSLGEFPICKETVELKIMMEQNSNIIDMYTNKLTKKLEEYGNVKLSFDLVPTADITTKINLMMNSGGANMPDIIISTLNNAQIVSYGDQGMLVPLNKYYENSSYYLKSGMDRIPEKNILKQLTTADGNIYSIPRYQEALATEFNNVMWIYKPWLEKLSLPMPKTLEEYRSVLKAFKENDMNGNGDMTDELPLADDKTYNAFNVLMNTFINFRASVNYLSVENGKLTFAYADDRWKEGLKYIKALVSDGLFTPVSFTMTNDQLRTIAASEDNKLGSFAWASPSMIPASTGRQADYGLLLLSGPDGLNNIDYKTPDPIPTFFITKNCKNPETAFRLGDLMCSEEITIWNRWGEKGVDWKEPAEGTTSLYDFLGYPALIEPILAWGSPQNAHWYNLGPVFRTYEISAGALDGVDAAQLVKAEAVKELLNHIPKETIRPIIFTKEELEEYNEVVQIMLSYANERRLAFVTGTEDIDSGWDKYISELKNIGLDRATQLAQTAYDRAK